MEGEERRLRLVNAIGLSERIAYYVAALFLIATMCLLFVSAAADFLEVASVGLLTTSLDVLDKVLLIFIFTELLGTITTIVREREVRAEPFLLIGLIAVVRRILAVTVSIEQSLGTPQFTSLLYELGVLTALIVVLAGALFFIRREEHAQNPAETVGQAHVPR